MFKFPFTNFHELNLDWILSVVKEAKTVFDTGRDDIDYAMETADEAKTIAQQAAQGVIADGAVTFNKIAPGIIAYRNLLANWCFLPHALINQRGLTVYNNPGYCINGWILGENSSLAVTANGIVLTGTLTQPVELPPNIYKATVLTPVGIINGSYNQNTRIFTITGNNTTIIAAKLETGIHQTLAYDSGNGWKLIDEPEYSVELEKVGVYDSVAGTVSRANGITGGTIDNVLAVINGTDVTLSARIFGVSYPANGNVLQLSEELWPTRNTRLMGFAQIENVGNVPIMATITTRGEVQLNYSSSATFTQFGLAGTYKVYKI